MNAVANRPEVRERPLRILVLEDRMADAELCIAELYRAGLKCDAQLVQTRQEFLQALDEGRKYDLVLADYSLPDWKGSDALSEVRQRGLDIPLIIVTGTLGDDEAVELVKNGVSDYVLKDRLKRLPMVIARALAEARERREKLAALEAVERSAREYRTLFESANVGILVFDPASEIVLEANPEACRMYHLDHNHLVGLSLKDFTRDIGRGEQQIVELLRDGECHNFDSTHFTADGSEINVLISSKVIEYRGTTAILSINRDVTARTVAEERYRRLFEEASDVIFRDDLDGDIVLLNPAGERVTGFAAQEIIGKNIMDFVAPEYLPVLASFIQRRSPSSKLNEEIEFIFREGKRVRLEVSAHYVIENGRPIAIEGIARDVTERRRLERELQQAQKMEAIGRLTGGVAHDFNNILGIIIGYSELLMEKLKEDQSAHHQVEQIHGAARRAASLTRQLLAFSRQQVLEPVVMNLNTTVSSVQQMLQRVIGEDIELVTTLDSSLHNITADPTQIEQVLLNLAVNARDAMSQGGTLTIQTQKVAVDSEFLQSHFGISPGPYAMLAASDTGDGMTDEVKAHIFEPFFTTKGNTKGTGLGLSTVYGIVTQSGGHIWVDSEPGHGTTFKIYFPAVSAQAKQVEERQGSCTETGSGTVLVVEDSEPLRTCIRTMLEPAGYRVLEAENGSAALLVASEHPKAIDLVITDVVMPEMSGKELALRLEEKKVAAPVLYVSGYTSEAISSHGILQDGCNFLQKPFSKRALLEKVREVFAKAHTLSTVVTRG